MAQVEDVRLDRERLEKVQEIIALVDALEEAEDRPGKRYRQVRQELDEARRWLEAVVNRYGYHL
jgi:hypothetical protein